MPPARSTAQRLAMLALASVVAGVLVAALALPVVGGVGYAARVGTRQFENLPASFQAAPLPLKSRIVAADGSTIANFYFENRVYVPLTRIAPAMRKAIVDIEDSRFYSHHGIDLKGVVRAAVRNGESGGVSQGGSTLTQQYVKLAMVESAKTAEGQEAAHARTLGRKLREARYALALEQQLTKDQILERYLNIAYYGDGAYGVESAARHYFGIPASRLTLDQAALLAGLVQSPGAYDPVQHPEAAKERRDTVLMRMAQLGDITQQEAADASATPLALHPKAVPNGCEASSAPYFCDYVLHEVALNPAFGPDPESRIRQLLRGGLTIRTTVQPGMQRAADAALRDHIPWDGVHGGAEAIIEPGTGNIRAIAVNAPFGSGSGHNRVNWAVDADHGDSHGFQGGSTFKAFVLAAAISKGIPLSTSFYAPQKLENLSGYVDCDGHELRWDGLSNAGDSESGTFDVRTGTWESVNTFYALLEKRTGVCEPVHIASALGLKRADGKPLQQIPAFTLGAQEVSPLDLADAYATLAAHGKHCPPVAITGVIDRFGKKMNLPATQCDQAIDPDIADTVTSVLQGVLDQPGATAYGQGIGRPAAGKTGTVDDYHAAWFAGYTPDLAAAVWIGFPQGGQRSLRDVTIGGRYFTEVFGASIPAPIWHDSMIAAHDGIPWHDFTAPDPSVADGRQVQVPDVHGLSVDAANAALTAAGLYPESAGYQVSGNVPAGTVAWTYPSSGSSVPAGSRVTVYVSDGAAPQVSVQPLPQAPNTPDTGPLVNDQPNVTDQQTPGPSTSETASPPASPTASPTG